MIGELNCAEIIDELINQPQYTLTFAEKKKRLLPLLEFQVHENIRALPVLGTYCERMSLKKTGFLEYEEVPYIPVTIFKKWNLCTVPESQVVRILTSSGTTGQTPSRIYLDKKTIFRQSRATTSTLAHFLGQRRRPFLVLDAPESNAEGVSLSARGAAIRAISNFASSTTFGLVLQESALIPNEEAISTFFNQNSGEDVLVFGFTYIVWLMMQEFDRRGIEWNAPGAVLLHSGGWKKLMEERVEKRFFNETAARIFGMNPVRVLDFYGMAEQLGVIFVDCEAGNKHTPNFAEVLIRDVLTFKIVEPGRQGLIEILSVLPGSYPGQAIVTEDIGILGGYDDCPCGRRGLHFRFRSRVEKAEVRGCGDTFASARVLS